MVSRAPEQTTRFDVLLEAGPFSASNGEGRRLFEGLTVRLEEARITLLEGPSGSGKSTLFRQLAGLAPAPGAARRLGQRFFTPASLPEWRARVVLLAQDAPMTPGSVGDNLKLPFALRAARDRGFVGELAARKMAAVGLGDIPLDREVRSLSGGERHRLALVRGLLWDPPVLLTDEPLSGLDEEVAATAFGCLLDFAHRPGHAVLCTLHEPSHGSRADRTLTLETGSGQ